MSYKQHHFSELEEEYYNYQLKMRKALSKEYSPIIEQQHKTFAGELKKIHDDGFVEVENNSPEYKEAFKKLQATVLSRYENNTSRTLSEPLAIEGLFEFVKEHNVLEFFEKRLNQTNVKQFLEENPNLQPAGLNMDSEYVVSVRKNK